MPTTLEALLVLVIFIAPGFLFTRSYWYGQPRYFHEPDTFQQIVTSVITSIFINLLLLVVMNGFLVLLAPNFPQMIQYVQPLGSLPPQELLNALILLTVYATASLSIGFFGGILWQQRSDPSLPFWWRLIAEPFARGEQPRLTIRFSNGQEIAGIVKSVRWIGSKEVVYEFVLRDVNQSPNSEFLVTSKDVVWIARA